MIICPFGHRRCPHKTNKKWQPNNCCLHFVTDKCTEEHRMYERSTRHASGGLEMRPISEVSSENPYAPPVHLKEVKD